MSTYKIALCVEYSGCDYFGWQRQANVPTIQQALEEALAKIAIEKIVVHCSGRTDAGVHATSQIVHFTTSQSRPTQAWTMGVNVHLPNNICVKWAREVPESFHARFGAISRRYRYVIANQRLRPGILNGGVTQWHKPLNEQAMHEAAQCLVGENDFSAFRAAHCQSNSPYRNVHKVSVSRHGHYVLVDIKANAFLHHMVRNIVGSLLVIGSNEKPTSWMKALLDGKDRTKAAATAKPHGLYFVKVDYPSEYNLPDSPIGPLFFPDDWY